MHTCFRFFRKFKISTNINYGVCLLEAEAERVATALKAKENEAAEDKKEKD